MCTNVILEPQLRVDQLKVSNGGAWIHKYVDLQLCPSSTFLGVSQEQESIRQWQEIRFDRTHRRLAREAPVRVRLELHMLSPLGFITRFECEMACLYQVMWHSNNGHGH